jgi:hypothetical protein
VLVFIAYLMVRWVTGPFFERVPPGPSDPPTYMKVACVVFQATAIPAALGCLYWFALRPWRRTGRLPLDGMLVIAFATIWVQDPLSAYGGHWFMYNAWLVNYGSWVHGVPGWQSFGEPGAMIPEPILMIGGIYVYLFITATLLGSWVLRKSREHWPEAGKLKLLSICFVVMCAVDLVFEGMLVMPLGLWGYPGGNLKIFPSTYHAYPLHEMITVGFLFTALASVRFFRDDNGDSIVERGASDIRSPRRRTVMRTLAVIGVVQAAMFMFYNVPHYFAGTHSTEWPRDVQKRSYFTNGLCGEGTNRACPGPNTPLYRNDNSASGKGAPHLGLDGRLVVPENTTLPERVPFDR